MNYSQFTGRFVIVCKFCEKYISYSTHLDHIHIEKIFGIKVQRYIIQFEYCNVFIGTGRTICCNNCERVIGIFKFDKHEVLYVELLSVRARPDVSPSCKCLIVILLLQSRSFWAMRMIHCMIIRFFGEYRQCWPFNLRFQFCVWIYVWTSIIFSENSFLPPWKFHQVNARKIWLFLRICMKW